jgi:hypothetical protein
MSGFRAGSNGSYWRIVLKNPKIAVPGKCAEMPLRAGSRAQCPRGDAGVAAHGEIAKVAVPPACTFKKPAHGPDFSGSRAKMGFFNTIGASRSLTSGELGAGKTLLFNYLKSVINFASNISYAE